MILKATPTGRPWGDKRDPVEKAITVQGCRCVVSECDVWNGPLEPGQHGEYFRIVELRTNERTQTWRAGGEE